MQLRDIWEISRRHGAGAFTLTEQEQQREKLNCSFKPSSPAAHYLVFPVDVQQTVLNKEAAPKELSPGVSQMDLETLNVKEEEEEPLHEMMETSVDAVSCKYEENEDKVLLSQFDQHMATERDLPTSSCPAHIKTESGEEDCGGAESTRNPNLNPYGDDSNSSESESGLNEEDGKSCCDCQLKSLSHSEPETEDSEKERNESESSESGVKAVNKSLSCPECGKPVLHTWSLQKHVSVTSLSAKRSSSCRGNKKGVGVERDVNSSGNVQAQLKSFICDDCGFSFTNKTKLKIHMRVHTGEKPFMCDVCGRRFSREANLISHIRVHTGQKPFPCELCGKRFSEKSSLKSHMRVHTGQKPFSCELCGKRFRHSSILYMHRRVHTGEKPYDCKLCGQNFCRKGHLMRHMSVHTGQKPFACDICGKRFSQKGNLNTHMRVHTGLKPFVCDVCGDRFRHKVSLNTHMGLHTGNKTHI